MRACLFALVIVSTSLNAVRADTLTRIGDALYEKCTTERDAYGQIISEGCIDTQVSE